MHRAGDCSRTCKTVDRSESPVNGSGRPVHKPIIGHANVRCVTTHRRHLQLTQDDQNVQRYYGVPFDLSGAESVEVKIDFDDSVAVVDLGCEDSRHWRGWSGGARKRFVISREAATPGYLPGELPDGTWSVILGLHRIPAEGITVEVEISSPAVGRVESPPPPPPVPDGKSVV